MAKYKNKDIKEGQGLFLTIDLGKQLLPGEYAYMLNYLIDNKMDLSEFEKEYKNDNTGAPAISPASLIKLILYGYRNGQVSSRKISELAKTNIIAKSLTNNTEMHWTTIANFISNINNIEKFSNIFGEVLFYCSELELIGGEMDAIDGCRMPSNASIELSGTKAELEKKLQLCREAAKKHIAKHQRLDEREELDEKSEENFKRRQHRLNSKIEKIENFLNDMNPKKGKKKKELKSNVTDNDSATIKSSKGYIQGYIGLAVVDKKNQIIVSAQAVGSSSECEYLPRMLDKMEHNLKEAGIKRAKGVKPIILGDAAYFSEDNLIYCQKLNMEAIIPDTEYRNRIKGKEKKYYNLENFKYHEDDNYYECPNGKILKYKKISSLRGKERKEYQADVEDCFICPLNTKCMVRKNKESKINKGRKLTVRTDDEFGILSKALEEKLKTQEYQDIYANRIQIVEPVFADITYCKGMRRFTLRGKEKVNTQWTLFSTIHNIDKCLKPFNKIMGYT